MAATEFRNQTMDRRRGIGPLGTAAWLLVAALLLGSVTWGHLDRGFHLSSWVLGLVGFPAVLLAVRAVRCWPLQLAAAPRRPGRLRGLLARRPVGAPPHRPAASIGTPDGLTAA
jgi:hypothetical protein